MGSAFDLMPSAPPFSDADEGTLADVVDASHEVRVPRTEGASRSAGATQVRDSLVISLGEGRRSWPPSRIAPRRSAGGVVDGELSAADRGAERGRLSRAERTGGTE